jgi:hypothetical protein
VDEELDWELLGRAACEGDGTTFYDAEFRERILDTGLWFAEDLGARLEHGQGQSLYLGAEVAELPLILAEHIVMQRRVEWLNVECAATTELARAIRAVSARLGIELPVPIVEDVRRIAEESCDHLWMVSVLTDPDAFPALHDELYERRDAPLATGRGVLDVERRRADALVEAWLARAELPCALSTTEEELVVIEPLVAFRGWRLELESGGRLSAIVGDRVRFGTLHAPAA